VGSFDDALGRFDRILRTVGGTGYRTLEAMTLNNMGDAYTHLGRAAEALPLIERAVAISRSIGHQVYLAIHLNTVLQAYSALNEHHQVILRAPEVLAQHELLGNAHQRAEHMLTMAKSLRELGHEAAAEEHVASARDCLAEIGTRERIQAGALFDHLITDVP
jgi:tetratricopeptide (TPR) repeat protein